MGRGHEDEGRQPVVRETNLAAFEADKTFYHADEAILSGERGNPGQRHVRRERDEAMRRGREIDAKERTWGGEVEGRGGVDIRELLLHRGDGGPCVGAHAVCLRTWQGS
jgi:hypothetical protein